MAYSTPTRKRPSKALRRTLITLGVLLLLLVVLDRGGDYIAERAAASTIQDSQELANKPDVDIGGFPFLTQVAASEFDEITITATGLPLGGDGVSLTLSRLAVTLRDVSFPRDFSSVHADTARAVGTVSYADLSRALGVDVSYAGDGRVKASKQLTVLGRTITPTVTAEPELVGSSLTFAKFQANGLGALAGQVSQVAQQVFDVQAPLQGIPFDIRVTGLSMDDQGLRIELRGADLTYTK